MWLGSFLESREKYERRYDGGNGGRTQWRDTDEDRGEVGGIKAVVSVGGGIRTTGVELIS